MRVSDGDGGFAYDSFTVTTEKPNLPEPYSFRFTDIKAVEGDPEGDKFQFEFEILNWFDTAIANNSETPEEDLIALFNGKSIQGLTLEFLNPEDNKFKAPINGELIKNLTDPESVPEPSTLGMLGLAVLSLWRCKRREQHQK